jgi:hypothetical protein
MITDKDIKKLIQIFPTRDEMTDLATKSDIDGIKLGIHQLQQTVDNFARKVNIHDQEITIINHRLDELENPV